MCYDVKTKIESMFRHAFLYAEQMHPAAKKELEQRLKAFKDMEYRESRFFALDHPQLLIYTNESAGLPIPATWGLIPPWIKEMSRAKDIWNKTVNARSETIFEKKSFQQSAKSNKCVLYVDGFFEHHHYRGKTYPYYIQRKDGKPFAIAGLYSEFGVAGTNEMTTFTLLTTKANKLLAEIHNNPKLKEPRMPVILRDEEVDYYLDLKQEERLAELFLPFPDKDLTAHTVGKIRGKDALRFVPEVTAKRVYPELFKDLDLFGGL